MATYELYRGSGDREAGLHQGGRHRIQLAGRGLSFGHQVKHPVRVQCGERGETALQWTGSRGVGTRMGGSRRGWHRLLQRVVVNGFHFSLEEIQEPGAQVYGISGLASVGD